MALSMFARTPGCLGPVLRKSLSQMKPSVMQRLASSHLSASPLLKDTTSLMKAAKSSPILNAVRSLRTSPVRCSAEKGGNHTRLWVIERAASILLVPLVPLALMYPNKILDYTVAVVVTAHSFWGLEAIAVDYVRASVVGPILPKVAIALVYFVSIATLGGLFYLINHDVGLANTVRSIWGVKSEQT